MLSEVDTEYVVDKLIELVAGVERPRETLVAPFLGTPLPETFEGNAPGVMVRAIVTLCLRDEWNNDPPWLLRLLGILLPDELDAKLGEIRRRLRVRPPPAPDPRLSTILATGMPFLDRHALRVELGGLLTKQDGNLQPILIVSGSARSGKSYSTEYINHFAYTQKVGQITPYRVVLKPEDGTTNAFQLADALVSMTGRSPTDRPDPNSNDERLAPRLAGWVSNNALQALGDHWFVLDNFRAPLLSDSAKRFVIAFAELITAGGQYTSRCRLILIGFDPTLLTVSPGRIREETINRLPDADITVCLQEILAQTPEPMQVGEILPLVANALPTDARLEELNIRLRALMRAVREVATLAREIPDLKFRSVVVELLKDLPSGQKRLEELRGRLDVLRQAADEMRRAV